jgi:ribosomal protein S18 acetylase RimI-like enzyme
MTKEVIVRDARIDESRYIMEMTRLMFRDLEQYGDRRTATTDESAWDEHAVRIAEELKGETCKYLIAEVGDGNRIGFAVARINVLEGVYAAKRIIHVSSVYVLPSFRRAGVGSELISRTLDWGRHVGGDYFDLNVVAGNPARALYRKFGFSDAAINMTRSIAAC